MDKSEYNKLSVDTLKEIIEDVINDYKTPSVEKIDYNLYVIKVGDYTTIGNSQFVKSIEEETNKLLK